MEYKTDQESFWAGQFGDEYSQRNNTDQLLVNKTVLFSKILQRTGVVNSVLEFGSNIGLNLQSIASLLPNAELSAIEINAYAKQQLEDWGGCKEVFHQSALTFENKQTYDLSMILGVLVHTNPSELNVMYEKLYSASHNWILIAESYNPVPVEIQYRGHEGRYYKRDFAGEMLEQYPDLKLVDYGFVYRKDEKFPLDDLTWFLLKKEC